MAVGLIGPDGADLPLRLEGEANAGDTTRVLNLKEASRSWRFTGLTAEPVPSVLRGYSAPVILEIDEDDERLAFRMAHDADPFNRWDAAQRFMERVVLGLAAYAAAGRKLEVDLGPRYQLSRYTLTGQSALPLPSPETLGLKIGGPALAADLQAAEAKALDQLAETGYTLAKFTATQYIVNHATQTLEANLSVDAGPKVPFGDVHFLGLERTHPQYLLNSRPWESGQIYSTTQLKAYQKALLDTDLFASVKLTPAQSPAPDGSLPIEAVLVERKPRSYGGSAGYSTDQGAGVTALVALS